MPGCSKIESTVRSAYGCVAAHIPCVGSLQRLNRLCSCALMANNNSRIRQ